jgi:hypothetical protein
VDTTTGSLGYMSPEQVHGKPTDGRSDLYSVGISLYEMVTGERPFKSNSDFAVMLAQVNEQPRPPIELLPSLSPALNAIILKAIAKDPAERFQSADEFRQALHTLPGIRNEAASSTETITWPPAVPVGAAAMGAAMAGPITRNDGIGSNESGPMLDAKTLSAPPPVTARAAGAPTADPWARSGLGHPVMFVILGGVLVIGALVGTGLYLGQAEAGPGRIRGVETSPVPAATAPPPAQEPAATPNPPVAPSSATEATPTPATAATEPNATAAAPPAPPPPPPPPPVSNDRPVTVQTPPADARPRALAAGSAAASRVTPAGSASSPATGKAGTPKQPARDEARPRDSAPNGAAVLDQLEREVDQLTVRVDAVNNGLDHLQREQARQGLGLRGDMVARQSSMNLNLSRAQQAVSAGDAARAQRYRDAAEADLEALEKFLGR